MSSPELLKFLIVRNAINCPRKLSHPVTVSKKSQAVTPDLAHQVQGELAANPFVHSQGKRKIQHYFIKGRKLLSRKQGV